MIGEVSIGGVYVPTILLLGTLAAIVTGLVSRLLAGFGLYRLVAYRPMVDVGLFVLVLGLLVLMSARYGTSP